MFNIVIVTRAGGLQRQLELVVQSVEIALRECLIKGGSRLLQEDLIRICSLK